MEKMHDDAMTHLIKATTNQIKITKMKTFIDVNDM